MERAVSDAADFSHIPRISQLAAGESHTLALTDDGKIYTWGKGFFGRLGTGSESDEVVPVSVSLCVECRSQENASVGIAGSTDGSFKMLPREGSDAIEMESKVVAIAAGAYHSLALTENGTVWSWGYNFYGQLGHDADNTSIPHTVSWQDEHKYMEMGPVNIESQDSSGITSKVVDVTAGGMMSCAIDHAGVLWIWGHIPSTDSEGPSALFACPTPQPAAGLQGYTVVKVACGNEHVLAIINEGAHNGTGQSGCYAWGDNSHGQLGLGDNEGRVLPQRVQALGEQVMDISCGGFHSAALSLNKGLLAQSFSTKTDGQSGLLDDQAIGLTQNATLLKRTCMCWTFGLGENGQLGHGDTLSLTLPKMVQGFTENEKLIAVSCGLFHTAILSETGKAWIWGMEGGLGLCPDIGPHGTEPGDSLVPVRVAGNHLFDTVVGEKLACGAAHTVVAVNNGTGLWAWGRGQNGVLGTGDLLNSIVPCKVVWPPFVGRQSENSGADSGKFQTVSASGSYFEKTINDKGNHSDIESLEKMLSLAQREICTLTADLTAVKHRAAVLHAALYGVQESGQGAQTGGVLQDLEKRVETASTEELCQLDAFYRHMHARVKDALLERKMERLCRQFMQSLGNDVKQSVTNWLQNLS